MADNKKKYVKKTNSKVKKPVQKKLIVTGADTIGPFYEYCMGKQCAYNTTHDVDGKIVKEAKGREQEYLVDFVNEQYGIIGTCIKVNVTA